MSCLSMTITLNSPMAMTVTPLASASADPTPANQQAQLHVDAIEPAVLTIGDVCAVGSGTIMVLAASDGLLRLCNGGLILLDPARESDT